MMMSIKMEGFTSGDETLFYIKIEDLTDSIMYPNDDGIMLPAGLAGTTNRIVFVTIEIPKNIAGHNIKVWAKQMLSYGVNGKVFFNGYGDSAHCHQ
jgi:hypothetical protein